MDELEGALRAPDTVAPASSPCIHTLFERQVLLTPETVAVVFGETTLNYRQLDARANQVAHYLRRCGVQADSLVALCVERSLDMPAAILGVLKAGGAYLPLDPSYPDQRLEFMMADARPVLVISQQKFAARFQGRCTSLCLDGVPSSLDAEPQTPCGASVTPQQLAYVIYTSGSSGIPKGVLVQHAGVVNHNLAVSDLFGLTCADRVSQCTSLSFDVLAEELFPVWSRGGAVVLHPPGVFGAGAEFTDWIDAQRITVLELSTAFWHEWVAFLAQSRRQPPRSVRLTVVGGEKASPRALATWNELCGDTVDWINGYGPTETTIGVTFFAQPRGAGWPPDRDIPIGRTIPGVTAYIVNDRGSLCADGEPGELCLAGVALARGYLNRPELTADRFVPNPFTQSPDDRLYRTGDIVLRGADGLLEFRGRIDDQVKIRGFRIEPGEIEAVLRRHPEIRDAAVVTHSDDEGEQRLIAYLVPATPNGSGDTDDVRSYLRATLPEYMVPGRFISMAALPLTSNGKVDRRALSASASPAPADECSQGTAAGSELERAIKGIWCELLGVSTAGLTDNFFDAGGHSMMAVKVIGRIRSELNVALPLRALFEQPTIAGLAHAVAVQSSKDMQDQRSASPWRYLFDLTPGRGDVPVFFLPGGFGGDSEFLVYARLVHFVGGDFKFMGLRAVSADGLIRAQPTVEAMASDYVDEMIKAHDGPYRLVGNCTGGVVAYEVARQLRQRGREVATLVLMDTNFPSRRRYARYRRSRLGAYAAGRFELLHYYMRRCEHHRNELATRRWPDRLRYVAGRAQTVIRDNADLRAGIDPREATKETYQQTLQKYRPQPYAGAVKFIVSEESQIGNAIGGWSELVNGNITVFYAPGDHDGYIRAHGKTVAEQLRRCLDAGG